MYKEYFANINDQVKAFSAPVQKFNNLVVGNVEKLAALQLATLQSYTQLSIAQLKDALEVNSPEAFKAYVEKQKDVLKTVSDKIVADTKAVTELSSAFGAEAQKIAQESIAVVAKKAA